MTKEDHIRPLFRRPVRNRIKIPVDSLFMAMGQQKIFASCTYHLLGRRIDQVVIISLYVVKK